MTYGHHYLVKDRSSVLLCNIISLQLCGGVYSRRSAPPTHRGKLITARLLISMPWRNLYNNKCEILS